MTAAESNKRASSTTSSEEPTQVVNDKSQAASEAQTVNLALTEKEVLQKDI